MASSEYRADWLDLWLSFSRKEIGTLKKPPKSYTDGMIVEVGVFHLATEKMVKRANPITKFPGITSSQEIPKERLILYSAMLPIKCSFGIQRHLVLPFL
jgi:hypothetical protein